MPAEELFHATCLIVGDRGVLLSGSSGVGKADLALRLLDRGAKLVSDDYTILSSEHGRLKATTPANIAGKMEVRGIGITEWPAVTHSIVHLLVELGETVERMPDVDGRWSSLAGIQVPTIRLNALEPSAPIKVELALRLFGSNSGSS